MGSFFPDDSILCQGVKEANRTKVGSETVVWVENTNAGTDKIAFSIWRKNQKPKQTNKMTNKNDMTKTVAFVRGLQRNL